jgi:hypothetical protein
VFYSSNFTALLQQMGQFWEMRTILNVTSLIPCSGSYIHDVGTSVLYIKTSLPLGAFCRENKGL